MPQRLAEALVGKPEKKAAVTLARPWPMNSWLLSRRCPDLSAMACAIDTAWVSETRATATALPNRLCSVAGERSGIDSGGNAPDKGPDASGEHRHEHRRDPREYAARQRADRERRDGHEHDPGLRVGESQERP